MGSQGQESPAWLPSNGKCPNQLARCPCAKQLAPWCVERGVPGVALQLPDQAEQVAMAGGG
jgi:hypothetical protein